MTITNTQIFGLIAGSIPGLNFLASPIKFAYYKSRETALTNVARAQVLGTAAKVNEEAQSRFNIKDEIPFLKWFALLQFIPIIGIYFAWNEKKLLERINTAISPSLNKPENQQSEQVNQPSKPIVINQPNLPDNGGKVDTSANATTPISDPLVQEINVLMDDEYLKIFSGSNDQREARASEILSDIYTPILPSQKLCNLASPSLMYRELPKVMWIRFLQNEEAKYNKGFEKILKEEKIPDVLFDFLQELKSAADTFTNVCSNPKLDQSNEAVITFNQRVLEFKTSVSAFTDCVATKCKIFNIEIPEKFKNLQ